MAQDTVSQPKSVLFVCTGNTCRSPMAVAIFRARLRERLGDEAEQWRVESAGILAEEGLPVAKYAQAALRQKNLEIENHRARTITRDLVGEFDLILTLTEHHKEAVSVEYPQIGPRIFTLGEMSGSTEEVDDPFGGPPEEYQRTAEKIDDLLAAGWERIMRLVNRYHPEEKEGAE